MEDDQDAFDKAFDEQLKASAPAPADAPAPKDEPAPEPAPAPAPAAAAEATPAPTVEQLQSELAEMRHRERSSANRIAPLSRQNNELLQQLKTLQSAVDELKAGTARPAAPAPAPEKDVLTEAPDLESAVRRRVNDLVEPLQKKLAEAEARVESVGKEAAQMRQVVEPIGQKAHQDQIAATHAALDHAFSEKWREDIKSPKFSSWIGSQPGWVQDLYESGVSVEDSASVLGRFYSLAGMPQRSAATPTPAPAPAGIDPQQRLRQAAGVAPRGNARPPANQGPAEDDFEGHFSLAAKTLKQA